MTYNVLQLCVRVEDVRADHVIDRADDHDPEGGQDVDRVPLGA